MKEYNNAALDTIVGKKVQVAVLDGESSVILLFENGIGVCVNAYAAIPSVAAGGIQLYSSYNTSSPSLSIHNLSSAEIEAFRHRVKREAEELRKRLAQLEAVK